MTFFLILIFWTFTFPGKSACTNPKHDKYGKESNNDSDNDNDDDEVLCTPTKKKKRLIFSSSSSDNASDSDESETKNKREAKVDCSGTEASKQKDKKLKSLDYAVPEGDDMKDGEESCDESDEGYRIQQFESRKALNNSFVADNKNNSCCSHLASQVWCSNNIIVIKMYGRSFLV